MLLTKNAIEKRCAKNRKWKTQVERELARLKTWLCPSKETQHFTCCSSVSPPFSSNKNGRFFGRAYREPRPFTDGRRWQIQVLLHWDPCGNKHGGRIRMSHEYRCTFVNIVACISLRNTKRKNGRKTKKVEVLILKICARMNICSVSTHTIAQFVTRLDFIYRTETKKGRVYEFWHHVMWPASWHNCITCKYCELLSHTVGCISFVAQWVLETQMKGSGTLIIKNNVNITFETRASL